MISAINALGLLSGAMGFAVLCVEREWTGAVFAASTAWFFLRDLREGRL